MEQVGIITGYSAIVEPGAAGLAIEAIVLIQISDNTRQAAEDFAAAVAKLPSVLTCDMTAGKLDYVVRVLARDLPHYEEIIKDHLGSLPNVVSMETLFVLNPLVRAKPVLFGK
jgi:DNA-binding Lrp family transcriptional regulator